MEPRAASVVAGCPPPGWRSHGAMPNPTAVLLKDIRRGLGLTQRAFGAEAGLHHAHGGPVGAGPNGADPLHGEARSGHPARPRSRRGGSPLGRREAAERRRAGRGAPRRARSCGVRGGGWARRVPTKGAGGPHHVRHAPRRRGPHCHGRADATRRAGAGGQERRREVGAGGTLKRAPTLPVAVEQAYDLALRFDAARAGTAVGGERSCARSSQKRSTPGRRFLPRAARRAASQRAR